MPVARVSRSTEASSKHDGMTGLLSTSYAPAEVGTACSPSAVPWETVRQAPLDTVRQGGTCGPEHRHHPESSVDGRLRNRITPLKFRQQRESLRQETHRHVAICRGVPHESTCRCRLRRHSFQRLHRIGNTRSLGCPHRISGGSIITLLFSTRLPIKQGDRTPAQLATLCIGVRHH